MARKKTVRRGRKRLARQTVRPRSTALLRELVKAKGYSVREMADRLPCGKSMISALMTGEKKTCSATLATRISEVLGVAPQVLFTPIASTSEDGASFRVASLGRAS